MPEQKHELSLQQSDGHRLPASDLEFDMRFGWILPLVMGLAPFFIFASIFVRFVYRGDFWFWLGSFVVYLAVMSVSSPNAHRLKLNKSGIELYKHRFLFIPQRRPLPWSDLHSIKIGTTQSTNKHVKPTKLLILDFRSGGFIRIPLYALNPQQLDAMFSTIAVNADPLCINPEALALQKEVLSGISKGSISQSFTRLWESSLKNNFSITRSTTLIGGTKLQTGKYTILTLLAGGGFSSVYLAQNAEGQRVVLKETCLEGASEAHEEEKIKELSVREATILAGLDHSHIVPILDFFTENERNYVVLEHVPGHSLRQLIQSDGGMDEGTVIEWAKQIVDALMYLHNQNPPLVHRDISPDNFIQNIQTKKIMLVDFGAANYFLQTHTGTLVGKQHYMSPEQVQGKAEPKSDFYGFGATLFFLLTGIDPKPLTQSSVRAVRAEISANLESLISQCTSYNLKERPENAEAILNMLEKCTTSTVAKK